VGRNFRGGVRLEAETWTCFVKDGGCGQNLVGQVGKGKTLRKVEGEDGHV
jgi:hypothetical protein